MTKFSIIFILVAIFAVGEANNQQKVYRSLLKSAINGSSNVRSSRVSGPMQQIIEDGAKIARFACQAAFQWDKWNCPASAFTRYNDYPETKEQAYIRAIESAGIVYKILQEYASGRLSSYTFSANLTNGENYFYQGINTRLEFPCESGCKNCRKYVEFAAEVTKQIFKEIGNDIQSFVNLQNMHLGSDIVKNAVVWKCESRRRSMVLPQFAELALILKSYHAKAVRVFPENSVRREENFLDSTLYYLESSPDYCHANRAIGWPGTKGRTCSRKLAQNDTDVGAWCRNLCSSCGWGLGKRAPETTIQCDSCEYFEFYCN